jgi:hypothetical protein
MMRLRHGLMNVINCHVSVFEPSSVLQSHRIHWRDDQGPSVATQRWPQAGRRRPPEEDEDEQELQAALRMSMEQTVPSVGARVKLHSLQQKSEHNGFKGEVLEFDASAGRWKVQLHPDGLVLALKASNLAVLAPAESDSSNAKLCDNCSKALQKPLMCARCKTATYCSKDCQVHTEHGAALQ